MKKIIILIAVCIAVITACKKDKAVVVVFTGYNYFPDNIGHELIYDVDSSYKDAFTEKTHHSFPG